MIKARVYIILMLFLLVCFNSLKAQLVITIDTIAIEFFNNVDFNKDTIITIDEDEGQGPSIIFYCKITNHSDTSICIFPKDSRLFYGFSYAGTQFYGRLYQLTIEGDVYKIEGGSSVEFFSDCWIFMGTELLGEGYGDYRDILLQVLPTLQVLYKDCNHKIESCSVGNVVLLN